MIPESHTDILQAKAILHLASIGPDGTPQNKPLWFSYEDGKIKFSTMKSRQNYRNIIRDSHVAVSIIHPENPYKYLEVRGNVSIEDDPSYAFINSLAKKYMGVEKYPMTETGDERVIATLTPTKVSSQG